MGFGGVTGCGGVMGASAKGGVGLGLAKECLFALCLASKVGECVQGATLSFGEVTVRLNGV